LYDDELTDGELSGPLAKQRDHPQMERYRNSFAFYIVPGIHTATGHPAQRDVSRQGLLIRNMLHASIARGVTAFPSGGSSEIQAFCVVFKSINSGALPCRQRRSHENHSLFYHRVHQLSERITDNGERVNCLAWFMHPRETLVF
jgi:hypothetical protein